MVISLGGITIVAAVLLSWVNGVTEAPIKEAEFKSQTAAMEKVMPQHDNNPFDDKFTTTINGTEVTIYPAIADGKLAGAAVESSADGFAGKIAVVYGFEADGTVKDYSVLQHSETPGLGSKMQEWFRDPQGKRSIVGRNPGTERLTVSKDGGDVDAITAATISSRAFLKTLDSAFKAYMEYSSNQKGQDNE
jgi:electron transport complex protein RnfG